jgi:hypothetical protein
MTALVLFLGFVGLCAFAARYGTDSRSDRPGRQI